MVFLVAIVLGTMLLLLPISRADAGSAPFLTALFTATSAVCVTGLIVVDTPTYWSGFGQSIILLLFQVGGFGIMTGATLLGLAAGGRIRLRHRLIAQVERGTLASGDVAGVLKLVLGTTLLVEVAVAAALCLRLHFGYGESWSAASWNAVFHAVSAFNNAGFSTYPDSLIGFQTDWVVIGLVMLAIIIGALGFPVLHEMYYERPRTWSLHTKITLLGTAALLVAGFIGMLFAEWSNPATLGPMAFPAKFLNAIFHSVTPRTAGFNSLDVGAFRSETITINYLLMFIGGGSAGTAGGIKVTTFFLLGIVVWSEIRGEPDAALFGRRINPHVERQAVAVILLAITVIAIGTLVIQSTTSFAFQDVLFETVSAFATVGLSTGITAQLPPVAQIAIIILMFVGRVGITTVAAALALGDGRRAYRYPEERPIVG